MSIMYVTAESLNFRSSPAVQDNNVIGSVFLMQPVELLADAADGWVRCSASLGGEKTEGFVTRKFLRAPVTKNREALIASVHREYMRFSRGLGKENVKPYSGYVGEMWKAIGLPHLDGTDVDVPWSAAAVSFMVRNAGEAYAKFKFAAAHSKFIHHAIQGRIKEDKSLPFWGYRLNEVKPQIGDIVARDNPTYAPTVTYDVAAALDSYRSHTDIVVHVDSAKQRLLAIGGNVGNTVGIAVYDLAPGDFLAETKHTFAILRNRTDD